jgi:hypothetical protein
MKEFVVAIERSMLFSVGDGDALVCHEPSWAIALEPYLSIFWEYSECKHCFIIGAGDDDIPNVITLFEVSSWSSVRSIVWVLYLGFHGPPVMTQKSGYDQFPLVPNGWGTKHPISDIVPPLLAKEKGLPT